MDSGRGIQVDVEDDEIIVTKPGTSFLPAYRMSVDEPRLVLTRSRMKGTIVSPAEFRDQAFGAAVNKARELRWII
jgi:hypothetical protein